ncbi:MAG: FAD-dependent oxidoreductase [Planctomycetes bacterium]|nr:FAD-dependent oxidoreductase [Planctomycetota bacterium]
MDLESHADSGRPHGAPIVVVGAGLAGASVAFALAQRGLGRRVHVYEQDAAPGRHATAQNAAMVRSLLDEDELAAWGPAGTRWWNALPAELGAPGLFRRTGSLLLAEHEATRARLEQRVRVARDAGLDARVLAAAEARSRMPILDSVPFSWAAYVAEDGVADPVALTARMLRAAEARGGTLHLGTAVVDFDVVPDDDEPEEDPSDSRATRRRSRLRSIGILRGSGGRGRLEPHAVVVASGAWAPTLLRSVPTEDRGLVPWRRHLAVIGDEADAQRLGISPHSPFVWHVDRQAYVRHEAGGVLASACDVSACAPGVPEVADGIHDVLHARFSEVFPFLLDLPVRRIWAGLRTYRPSHDFVLGRDPSVGGLHFACGLGGHGVTCVGVIGEFVAASLTD